MRDMPRPRKPYTQKEITRHGKTVWYFRRGKEKRIRLPGAFGSAEFNAAYEAALRGEPVEKKATAPRTSFRWLVDQYYESGRFLRYAAGTQRAYRGILEGACEHGGNINFKKTTKKDIQAGKVRREKNPYAAQAYVSVMKLLFQFAIDSGWMDENPADGIGARRPRSDGYHTWSVDEVKQFQAKYALGTQQRLAMDIMLYTGLRLSDAISLGPQHIKNGVITIKTKKTGVELTIPVLPPLAESIAATKVDGLLFLPAPRGGKRNNITASVWFAGEAKKAGIPGSAHGLRKAGATIAAENGATAYELMAMYGWSSPQMAEVYTKKANRTKLAEQAANKLYPHQSAGAGDNGKKDNENNG